jgi:hypothetical protein
VAAKEIYVRAVSLRLDQGPKDDCSRTYYDRIAFNAIKDRARTRAMELVNAGNSSFSQQECFWHYGRRSDGCSAMPICRR